MMPSEISRRKLKDNYFVCSCGLAWQDATYEVALEDCTGEFMGTETRAPAGLCYTCSKKANEVEFEEFELARDLWKAKKATIPVVALVERQVYKLRARNLQYGVYAGENRFMGIRLKFTSMFVDVEYHWDQGPPFGTCRPLEALEGVVVPEHIELHTGEGSYDPQTKRQVESRPRDDGTGLVNWHFSDTGEMSEHIRPHVMRNHALFHFLMGIEATYDPNFQKIASYCAGEIPTLRPEDGLR